MEEGRKDGVDVLFLLEGAEREEDVVKTPRGEVITEEEEGGGQVREIEEGPDLGVPEWRKHLV